MEYGRHSRTAANLVNHRHFGNRGVLNTTVSDEDLEWAKSRPPIKMPVIITGSTSAAPEKQTSFVYTWESAPAEVKIVVAKFARKAGIEQISSVGFVCAKFTKLINQNRATLGKNNREKLLGVWPNGGKCLSYRYESNKTDSGTITITVGLTTMDLHQALTTSK